MSEAIATGFPRAPAEATPPQVPSSEPPLTKVIVAIHGIGSQRRSDTIRSVAHRFGDRVKPPLPVMPLGFFHIGKAGEVQVSRLDVEPDNPLRRIGFAEVFWADIPRQVVKDDDTLDETKAWGTSVVSRAQAMYTRKVTRGPELAPTDFRLGSAVIEEIVETVDVLENLFTITAKMGIFKFDVAPLLRDYIGDVQLVTDFSYYRGKIVSRFHSAMAQIVKRYQDQYPGQLPEIHVVAHSEGTVVSFLGLLEALAGKQVSDADGNPIPTDWIQCVRGFMTIGSPIDKHIVLWPKLWEGLNLKSEIEGEKVVFCDGRPGLPHRIVWRNYYDYGDPIGFQLESAAAFLRQHECKAFDFESTPGKDDFGFSRYLLPGKAHNDYWDDPEVFGHFIDDVVMPTPEPAVPPRSSTARGVVSTAIPYALALTLHMLAVFLLYKGVTAFLDASQKLQIGPVVIDTGAGGPRIGQAVLSVVLLGLLLAGITVTARVPHLVKTAGWRWHLGAVILFAAASVPTLLWLPAGVSEFLGPKLVEWIGGSGSRAAPQALVVISFAIALSGWYKYKQPRMARRVLIAAGATLVLGIMCIRIWAAQSDQSQWPVLLAGAAFLYLWWLGVLFFDLAFVWHRYIRYSVAANTLHAWSQGYDATPVVCAHNKKPRAGDAPPRAGAAV